MTACAHLSHVARNAPGTVPSTCWVENLLLIAEHRLVRLGLGPRTERVYLTRIRHFLVWLGRYPGGKPREVQRYLAFLANRRGLRPATCRQARSALRFLFCDVLRCSRFPGNARRRKTDLALCPPAVARLLAEAGTVRNRVLIGLLYESALRLSEARRVRVGDVKLRSGTVLVRDRHERCNRIAVLSRPLMAWLPNLLDGRKPGEFVFAGPRGQPLTTRALQKALYKLGRSVGLAGSVGPRALRRSFALHQRESDAHPVTVRELLGTSRAGSNSAGEGG